MVIKAHSDALYFLESQARSIEGGFFYMGGANADINRPNGAIVVISTITRKLMSSAAEAECGSLLYNAKEFEAIRTTLRETIHPQQATEIITENSTSYGIMRGNIKQKRTKAM